MMVVWYGVLPMAAMCLGAWLVMVYDFNARLMSAAQHLSAGIVLAVVACEFVPSFLHHAGMSFPVVGFVLGMAIMLLVKVVSEENRRCKFSKQFAVVPVGMILAIALDIFIDGMLMGVGFAASNKAGQLVTFSLSIEIFFLGVALVSSCKQYGVRGLTALKYAFGTSVFVFFGFLLMHFILQYISSDFLVAFESFGIAALLYLAVEELLVDAHDVSEDLPWMTAPLFIGFLLVMVFEKL